MTQQPETLANRISDVSALMSQAESVLTMVGHYDDDPEKGSACYGAATIVRVAIDALNKIEAEARHAEAAA